MKRIRLDQLVFQRGLAESRQKAGRLIIAGQVRVNGQVKSKPGHAFPDDVDVTVDEPDRFVGRGGLKLESAFEHFDLRVDGLTALDVGASTGGFTDCLLQHGAAHVYAIDVGKGQLHWKLRNDDRVTVMEGINARYLKPEDIPERPEIAVIDVSFISLTKILAPVRQVLADGAHIVALVKPQFEAGKKQVARGGVVRDPAVHEEVVSRIRAFGTKEAGLEWLDSCPSPVKGPAGNIEFLSYWKKK